MQSHRHDLEQYLNFILHDRDKLNDFLKGMREFKLRKRMERSDSEDPSRFVVRNLELANVWDQYEQDRKRMMS